MLSLLHKYEHGDAELIELLKRAAIIFVPLVNPDGVAMIDDNFLQTSQLSLLIRKNRNVYYKQKGCMDKDQGVDLNRNYHHMWSLDDAGSSGLVCAEDFRGPRPFSEPET